MKSIKVLRKKKCDKTVRLSEMLFYFTALTLSTQRLRNALKIAGFYADWIYFVFLKIVLDFTTIEIYDIVSHVVLTQRFEFEFVFSEYLQIPTQSKSYIKTYCKIPLRIPPLSATSNFTL
jgi:hypothetical protein